MNAIAFAMATGAVEMGEKRRHDRYVYKSHRDSKRTGARRADPLETAWPCNSSADASAAAKSGGVVSNALSIFGTWLQNTYSDPVGSIENRVNQGIGQVQSGAQQTMSQSTWALISQSVANGVNAVLGSGAGLPLADGLDSIGAATT